MAGHENSLVRPQAAQDENWIAAGSPLAIQGIFLEILRERFHSRSGLKWTYSSDLQSTGIVIETSYNEETESRSTVPALYVTRYETRPNKVNIGDRAGVRLRDHYEGFSALMTSAMGIECVSNDEGESSILGDLVQCTIMATQDVIQREFGLYDISHPILGQTQPFEQGQSKFSSTVQFSVDFWVRWSQVPIRPLISQIAQRVQQQGQNTFRDAVLNSMRRGSDE